jgi:hypothetical protein
MSERLEKGCPGRLLKLRRMGTQRVQMIGVLPWLVRWASCTSTKYFCYASAALVGPVQNILFLIEQFFNSFVPIAKRAGQAAVQGRLSLSTCLWSWLTAFRFILLDQLFSPT